ncbi:hypothetical protein J6590_028486 [Homalodisca vitripennis]|nr:hypothetical protein J6590_028486 [Homalodisca vitripennis]
MSTTNTRSQCFRRDDCSEGSLMTRVCCEEMEVFVENLKPYIDFDCSEGSLMTRVCCEEMEVFVENLKTYIDFD